ncbi:hypothetical protein ACG7TL_002183 [Trametes sanguinea]
MPSSQPLKEDLLGQLIGFTFATTLYGISLMQGYMYYRKYERDSRRLKTLVAVMLILDTLTSVTMAHAWYTYVVLDFGKPTGLLHIVWSYALENALSVVTSFIVQCFYAHIIWSSGQKNKMIVALICIFATMNLGAGLALSAQMSIHTNVFSLGSVTIRALAAACNGSATLCDLCIAWALGRYPSDGRWNSLTAVEKAFVQVTSRGALTTLCQLMHLILTVGFPGHFFFLPFTMPESKLYTNSLLMTMNLRPSHAGTVKGQMTTLDLGAARRAGQLPGSGASASAPYSNGSAAAIQFPASHHRKSVTTIRSTARQWREHYDLVAGEAFEYAKSETTEGTARPSMVQKALSAMSHEVIPEDIVKYSAAQVYSGGADTTASTIVAFVLMMVRHPEVQSRARAEIDNVVGHTRLPTYGDRAQLPYVDAVLAEVLRVLPPIPAILRQPENDDIYDGCLIPKGTMMIENIWGMLHDRNIYPEPDAFMPERWLNVEKHDIYHPLNVAFGFGRRSCPGRLLAEELAFTTIALLLSSFDISCAHDEDGNPVIPMPEQTNGSIMSVFYLESSGE